ALARIEPNNDQGEFYLTDVIGLLASEGRPVEAVPVEDADEVLGVNTRVELAQVGAIMRGRILRALMLDGVTIVDPASTYVDSGVQIGADTVVEPNSYLLSGTAVGERCSIGPQARILNSRIGD